jgi:hypothetical protein
LSKTAAELAELIPVPKKKKFEKVSSSGYGVVNPVPSVPAKVAEVKNTSKPYSASKRSPTSIKIASSRDSDAENETPFANDSLAQINDLISKAASLDPQMAAASDGADSGGEEMLTML